MDNTYSAMPEKQDASIAPQIRIKWDTRNIDFTGLPERSYNPLPIIDMLAGCYVTDGVGNVIVPDPPCYGHAYCRHSRQFMINALTLYGAELVLHMAALHPTLEQKYFALGLGEYRAVAEYRMLYPMQEKSVVIHAGALFDMDLVNMQVTINIEGQEYCVGAMYPTSITQLGMRPLLWLSTYCDNFGTSELAMAGKICEENGIDPSACTASSFGIEQASPIQFSCLDNQYATTANTYWVLGENRVPYYRIEKVFLRNGEVAFLPVQFVCKQGCKSSRPMFLPPKRPHFVNEWQISDTSRPLAITSHLEMVDNNGYWILPYSQANVLSDYDMAGNIDRLPWELLRGRTVYYLLLYNEITLRHELDLAIRVCAKIRDAGYGHPRIVDYGGCIIDGRRGVTFTDQQFGQLIAKHGQEVDLRGFRDYEGRKNRLPAEPTAIPYAKTTELFLVLGEPKAGKTWALLHHLLQIAFKGDKPSTVLYLYGEGEKAQIDNMVHTLKTAMGIGEDAQGEIKLLDAQDVLGEGDGVFDLVDPQCGPALVERIVYEKKQAKSYPLMAVGLDNYASLAGKGQTGDASAVTALNAIRRVQDQGVAVFLACHTNREGLVASSEQFERRANGTILVTKKAPWQEELERKWLARTKKHKPDAQQARDMIINEIDEKSRDRDCVKSHISFQRFRGEQPDGYEMLIQLSTSSLRITPVTPEIQKAYVDELANQGSAPLKESPSDSERVRAISGGPSLSDLDTMAADERIQRLAAIVREGALHTRTQLAEVLGCCKSTLDLRMTTWEITNQGIGLQVRRGRKSKCK